MQNTQILSNDILIICIVGLGAIVAMLFYLIIRRDQQKEKEEQQRFHIYQRIISEAYQKAELLLASGTKTSAKLMLNSKTTNEKLIEDLDKTLQLVAEHHIHSLNESVGSFQKEYLAYLGKVKDELHQQAERTTQTAQKTIDQTIEAFSKSLLGKTLGAQEIVDVKVQTMIAEADKEIGEYKKAQLSKIDQEVKRLIQMTYEEILKETIPDEVNDKLILEALDKAKKEGVFTI